MRLGEPLLPTTAKTDFEKTLVFRLTNYLRSVAKQLNGISEGYITATTNAYTAAPTTGTWQVGDFIRNSSPSEAGTAGNKYIVYGWTCSVAGTPGTWLQVRTLTGN